MAFKGTIPWNKGIHLSESERKRVGSLRKGTRHTEASKELMRQRKLGKPHPISEEGRKGQIEGMKRFWTEENRREFGLISLQRIKDGKIKGYGNSGWFYSEKNGKKVFYASETLELVVCKRLENDPWVIFYQTQPCVIPYEFEDHIRGYVPDILVECFDGSYVLIECKREDQINTYENQCKFEGARFWCSEQKETTIFKVVGYLDLKEKGISFL